MPKTTVTLDKRTTNHCLNVLRLRSEQPIELFCGDDHIYPATLKIDGKKASAFINDKISVSTESNLKIHLAQGLARNDRMDWIIQKAVECGVTEITPLITEKSLIKIKSERLEHKQLHWQNIIISACEQSGRNQLPIIHPPTKLLDWIGMPFDGDSICFEPNGSQSVSHLKCEADCRILLGPESGLTSSEIKAAYRSGFQGCHLGSRILRTETATVAAVIALQSHFGDLK